MADLEKVLAEMDACIEDPMWAGHVELSKNRLIAWRNTLTALVPLANSVSARVVDVVVPLICRGSDAVDLTKENRDG